MRPKEFPGCSVPWQLEISWTALIIMAYEMHNIRSLMYKWFQKKTSKLHSQSICICIYCFKPPSPPPTHPRLSLSLKFRFILSCGLFEIHLSLIIFCNSLRGCYRYVLEPLILWINRKGHYYLIYILVKLSHKLYHKFDCFRCEESLVLHFITGWWTRYLYISYTNLQNIVYICSKKSKNSPLISKKT